MRNKSIGILSLFAASILLLTGEVRPAEAAPSSKKTYEKAKKEKFLPSENAIHIAFATAVSMTGLAVLLGTGKSMKYNGSSKEETKTNSTQEKLSEQIKTEVNTDTKVTFDNNKLENKVTDRADSFVKEENSLNLSQSLSLNESKADDRQIYHELQQQVYQSPDFANNPNWEADSWEVDVEIAIAILSKSPNNYKQVKQVLLESDRVRDWKKSLPEEEYRTKTSEYIDKAYNWAKDLHKWRREKITAAELSPR